ncbi:MAG: hypothetical protein Q8P25_00330 [Candidatus Curtissbacteria bacterium]|nr:hypothetical protein [Candidatus Curtissbacteria bacterium]
MIAKIGVAILALALTDLIYINYWMVRNSRIETSSQRPVETDIVSSPSPDIGSSPSPLVSPSSTPTTPAETKVVETKTVVEKQTQTIVQTAQKEIFIPLGSGSTKSNSYVDLGGLQVNIDTTKYSPIDSVIFESSIRVEGGNGKMYARLYQKDVGGVIGSEISTSSAGGILGSSSSFLLPTGNRVYTVQAKTDLVEFPAYVDGARVKITLK